MSGQCRSCAARPACMHVVLNNILDSTDSASSFREHELYNAPEAWWLSKYCQPGTSSPFKHATHCAHERNGLAHNLASHTDQKLARVCIPDAITQKRQTPPLLWSVTDRQS
jgi:hypothetical protein